MIREPGAFEQTYDIPDMWKSGPSPYDRGIARVMAVIRDAQGRPVGYQNWKGDRKDYFPMKARLTVHLVPRGDEYVPRGTYGGLSSKDLTALPRIARMLEQGRLGPAMTAARRAVASSDPGETQEARRVVAALERYADGRLERLASLKKEDPVYAASALADLAGRYSGTDTGRELSAQAKAWHGEDATRRAREAQALASTIRTAFRRLRDARGEPEKEHPREVRMIAAVLARLTSKYPDTPACRRAVALAKDLGIRVP